MNEVVLDASVVLKWTATDEPLAREAGRLHDAYAAGRLHVSVPSLLFLEILNAAGRGWRLAEAQLLELASATRDLRFDVREPDLLTVAEWVSRGLTSYDAAYVALAQQLDRKLVTADEQILCTALHVATALDAPM